MVVQDPIQQKYLIWADMFYPICYIYLDLHKVISIFFVFWKMLWMTENFREVLVKTFFENFLCSKTAELYLREIKKILGEG